MEEFEGSAGKPSGEPTGRSDVEGPLAAAQKSNHQASNSAILKHIHGRLNFSLAIIVFADRSCHIANQEAPEQASG